MNGPLEKAANVTEGSSEYQKVPELNQVLKHLRSLVAFDTRNPPRAISADAKIIHYLKKNLPGFKFEIIDAGAGSLCLLATRGTPEYLFNFHIDTVPIADGWTFDPFQLYITEERVYGLGACDIKGAAACMLSAVMQSKGDVALLFSTDEEHGKSDAIKTFLRTKPSYKKVIVAEPTLSRAVLAHRGICSIKVDFFGESGHASEPRALKDNAIHKAAVWTAAAINWVEGRNDSFDGLDGIPFNIGKIEGGIKANMIAANCSLNIGFRPLPGQCANILTNELQMLAEPLLKQDSETLDITNSFEGPSLPAPNQDFSLAIDAAQILAEQFSLPIGKAVSFWTEASLFSQSGMTAIVFGPGDIAQAHTADEWVSLQQLHLVEQHYIQILDYINNEKSQLEQQS